MNAFQWVSVSLLSAILSRELIRFFDDVVNRRTRLVRAFVWAAAIVAILQPSITQSLATYVGITRGADLVIYVFMLAALGMAFSFYANQVRLQRQLTDLVRHLAMLEAKKGQQD